MRTAERCGPVLVFDGDCGFCTSCVELAQRYVVPEVPAVPWQHSDLSEQTRGRAREEVLLLHSDGRRVWGGIDAVAVLMVNSPHLVWIPIGWLLRRGPVRALGAAAYRWVAHNRHRMPGATPACELHPLQ